LSSSCEMFPCLAAAAAVDVCLSCDMGLASGARNLRCAHLDGLACFVHEWPGIFNFLPL
jgi:hypothetical protein